MTSGLASIGLSYDGVDLQDWDNGVFLQVVVGLNEPPSVRGVDVTVPSLPGRIEANRVNDVIAIELRGIVRADTITTTTTTARSSYRLNAAAIRALFATNRARADLVATLEDGTDVVISARPLNLLWPESIQSEFANLSVQLEGYDDWAPVGS